MAATIDLIVGSAPLLAVHLAAHLLNTTDHGVCWVVERSIDYDLASRVLKRLVPQFEESRFRLCPPGEFQCHDAWVLSSSLTNAGNFDADKQLIAVAQRGRPINLNYVGRGTALTTSVLSYLKEVRAVCFCIDGVFDATDGELLEDDLMRIVHPLGTVIREVQERWSEYFDLSPLRIPVDPDRKIQLLRVDAAVRLMFELLEKASSCEIYSLGSSFSMSAGDLCSCLSRICHVDLRPAGIAAPLNAIDQLLAERLHEAGSILTLNQTDRVDGNISVEAEGTDAPLVETMLRRAYQNHASRYEERDQKVAALPQHIQTKTVTVGNEELTYYQAGSEGSALILLSALGQGIEWWVRLIEPLMHKHRVYVWEPRGVMTATSEAVGLEDHVTDIEAVIAAEGLSECVLVGWCNGPQVAVEFYNRHPEMVRGMVFLNCTFEVPGRPELDAPYEKYFRKLCEVITTRPQFTPSAMKTLGTVPEPKRDDLIALDEDKRASTVIRLPPRQLRPHVVRPFESVETTRRYAAQVLDYFAHDSLAHASEISTPLLVLSAEYDSVVSPERVEAIAACFPRSLYFSISGATHYALYEQSETVALKIERFLSEC